MKVTLLGLLCVVSVAFLATWCSAQPWSANEAVWSSAQANSNGENAPSWDNNDSVAYGDQWSDNQKTYHDPELDALLKEFE